MSFAEYALARQFLVEERIGTDVRKSVAAESAAAQAVMSTLKELP